MTTNEKGFPKEAHSSDEKDGNQSQSQNQSPDVNPNFKGEYTMNNPKSMQLPTNEEAQKLRVLVYLQTHSTGLNRYEADDFLNVCHLAARINALKADGHIFLTVFEAAADFNGRQHNGIARYFWQGHIQAAVNDRNFHVTEQDNSTVSNADEMAS